MKRNQLISPFNVTNIWKLLLLIGIAATFWAIYQVAFIYTPTIMQIRASAESLYDGLDTGNTSNFSEIIYDKEKEFQNLEKDVLRVLRSGIISGFLSVSSNWIPLISYEAHAYSSYVKYIEEDVEVAAVLANNSLVFVHAIIEAKYEYEHSPSELDLSDYQESFSNVMDGFHDISGEIEENFGRPNISSLVIFLFDLMELRKQQLDKLDQVAELGQDASQLAHNTLEILTSYSAVRDNLKRFDSRTDAKEVFFDIRTNLQSANDASIRASANSDKLLIKIPPSNNLTSNLESFKLALEMSVYLSNIGIVGMESLIDSEEIETSNLVEYNVPFWSESTLAKIFSSLENSLSEIEYQLDKFEESYSMFAESRDNITNSNIYNIFQTIDDLVFRSIKVLELIPLIAPIASDLLPADDERKYLVLGQSSDELRATGGFVFGAWVLSFRDSKLSQIKYFDVVNLDDHESLRKYPKAPEGLKEHMNAWVWLMRDVTWEPDFPSTAIAAQNLLYLGQGTRVDGVLAVNQVSFLNIMDALGSISISNEEGVLNSRDIMTSLERSTDDYGRKYTDGVLKGIINGIRELESYEELIAVISSISDSIRSRDIYVYLNDADSQAVVDHFNMDGSVKAYDHDYIFVVDSNVGWNKADRNIERALFYEVDLRSDLEPNSRIHLRYVNHSGPSAVECEPQWVSRGKSYDQQINACYWNYLRVYLPLGSVLETHEPLPLPQQSMSVINGFGSEASDSVKMETIDTHRVFSGLSVTGASKESNVILSYKIPNRLIKRDKNCLTYSLLIRKQPGVSNRQVFMSIILPDESKIIDGSHNFIRENSKATLSLNMTSDIFVSLTYRVHEGEFPAQDEKCGK